MPSIFDADDDAYQAWLANNSAGYVVNARRSLSPSYFVLHNAACRTIRNYTAAARRGAFTERGYVKICSASIDDLQRWVRQHGRLDGSFSKKCRICGAV